MSSIAFSRGRTITASASAAITSHVARMSPSGQTRPFALVEPRASFTVTSRHSPDNQVVALGPMLSAPDRSRFFGKKSQMARRDFSRAVPETFAMVDGRRVDGHAARLTSRSPTADPETLRDGRMVGSPCR